MYQRTLNLREKIAQKSHFLLGARQTGKTTLINELFPEARKFNLLAADTFRELSSNPEIIRQSLNDSDQIIVIDEIQKLPSILDEVHLLIESNKKLRFILTGSNARKLKRSGVNLLAGRAWTEYLFPLTTAETEFKKTGLMLLYGGLPAVINSSDPWRELQEYVGVYLQEEIRAESLARSIESFSRFLTVAGFANGQQLNYTKIANDAQVPPRTIREFYSVLEDTLIGYQVHPLGAGNKRKAVSTSKFYFFDLGVAHALQGIKDLTLGTAQYGIAVEHLIANEIRAFLQYNRIDKKLKYWRSLSQIEVDFIIEDLLALEVKTGNRISENETKGLRALSEEFTFKRKIIISNEKTERTLTDNIEIMPLAVFLKKLWAGEIIDC